MIKQINNVIEGTDIQPIDESIDNFTLMNVLAKIFQNRVVMATSRMDIPAPTVVNEQLSNFRPTNTYYMQETCVHEFKFIKQVQIRRGDESISAVYSCSICGYQKIK